MILGEDKISTAQLNKYIIPHLAKSNIEELYLESALSLDADSFEGLTKWIERDDCKLRSLCIGPGRARHFDMGVDWNPEMDKLEPMRLGHADNFIAKRSRFFRKLAKVELERLRLLRVFDFKKDVTRIVGNAFIKDLELESVLEKFESAYFHAIGDNLDKLTIYGEVADDGIDDLCRIVTGLSTFVIKSFYGDWKKLFDAVKNAPDLKTLIFGTSIRHLQDRIYFKDALIESNVTHLEYITTYNVKEGTDADQLHLQFGASSTLKTLILSGDVSGNAIAGLTNSLIKNTTLKTLIFKYPGTKFPMDYLWCVDNYEISTYNYSYVTVCHI